MRLLDTTTLKLNEFFASSAIPNFTTKRLHGSGKENNKIPPYAILSHVWGPEEVSFQDMVGDRKLAERKGGFFKVKDSCAQAQRDGYQYIWIDTCCIDKTSSTELSEAINSMYAWYKDSAVCYVYLADVFDRPGIGKLFPHSRWFTRGWTLQELLAPSQLQFFDRDWTSLGAKSDCIEVILDVTKIDLYALMGGDLSRLSVARRMSWVANRQTTRVEDMAYCLLGIFGIHMPLLYGEGAKSFIRLQEEIIKTTDDQSIFAWRDPAAKSYRDDYPEACKPQGLLAPYPELFQHSKSIEQFYTENPGLAVSAATNKGLKVELLMCQDSSYPSGLVYIAVLSCATGQFPGQLAGIRLRRLASTSEQYARVDTHHLFQFASWGTSDSSSPSNHQLLADSQLISFDPTVPQLSLIESETKRIFYDWKILSIYIKQEPKYPLLPVFWLAMPEQHRETVRDWTTPPWPGTGDRPSLMTKFKYRNDVREAYPPQLYDPETRTLQPQRQLGQGSKKLGALLINYKGIDCTLILGITYWESTPWCQVMATDPSVGNYSSYLRDDDIPFIGSRLLFYQENREYADRQRSYLRRAFDDFNVNIVTLPSDMKSRNHRCVCESLGLVSTVEHTTISGREVYLLRLLKISEESEQN